MRDGMADIGDEMGDMGDGMGDMSDEMGIWVTRREILARG